MKILMKNAVHRNRKMIRTFHYGEDGADEYLLRNLNEDIGESRNLAAAYPEKVKVLGRLIDDYIAGAKVVVPLPNPKFDSTTFDLLETDVQAGGLKMPPSHRSAGQNPDVGKPATKGNSEAILESVTKNAAGSIDGELLRVIPSGGQPFVANATVRAIGPVDVGLRVQTRKNGTGQLQWRTEGQDSLPKAGRSKSFAVSGEDSREFSVPLDVEGVIQLRLFLSDAKAASDEQTARTMGVGDE